MKVPVCAQEDINAKHLCAAELERILVFLAEDVPLIYLQTQRAMIYWSQHLAGRSKAELIRCETHGAFRQGKRGRDDEKKRKIADKGGAAWVKLETCPFNMSNLAEPILSSGERRWPPRWKAGSRLGGGDSRRCLILALSLFSVALMYNWCILGMLCH